MQLHTSTLDNYRGLNILYIGVWCKRGEILNSEPTKSLLILG